MLFLQFLLNLLIIKESSDFVQSEFENFIEKYEKPYRNDTTEYQRRIKIFHNSLEQIKYLNSLRTNNESAYYGVTQFSDLSSDEFQQLISKNKKINKKNKQYRKRQVTNYEVERLDLSDVPEKFDWRDRNVVSPVRNQGKCGACWAHSTVATVESMVAIKTNKLTEFSVQQLIDCSGEENQGCLGGDTCSALIWMNKNNISLETSKQYPNSDYSGPCNSDKNANGVQILSNYTCDSFLNNEHKMIRLLANHGPLIAAVDASTWQNYLGGIIQFHCFNELNHAVQITGYDLTGPIPYYKVRNTWDVGFGINGYIHIEIGNNLCGISEEISALDVKKIPKYLYKK